MARIVLFGPPAVGKSTLIQTFSELSIPSLEKRVVIDLECVDPESRKRLASVLTQTVFRGHLIVGAANLHPPQDFPWDSWRVVGLIPKDDEAYIRRFNDRNRVHPDKANQNELERCHKMREHCDRNKDKLGAMIDPLANGNPEELALIILRDLGLR